MELDDIRMNFANTSGEFRPSSKAAPSSVGRPRTIKIGERNRREQELATRSHFYASGTPKRPARCQPCLVTICLIELIVILFVSAGFLYYNLNDSGLKTDLSSDKQQLACLPQSSNTYRVYTNGVNTSRILMGLVSGCNQRKHDLPFGIECQSSKLANCRRANQGHLRMVNGTRSHRQATETMRDEPRLIRNLLVVTSSKSGKRLHSQQVPIQFVDSCLPGTKPHCNFKTRLRVYLNEKRQSIIGWGGALTDSAINNMLGLSVNGTRSLLDDYFSKTTGLGYNMIRITIGGSDFSARFYTNDDLTRSEGDDFNLEKFKLHEEDSLYKIPLIRLIQTEYEQRVKLFASMWSPPLWMKTNFHHNKGQIKGSINTTTDQPNSDRYFRALANLKIKFMEAYQRESIIFWGLTVMNEPFFAREPFIDFNIMIFPKNDYAAYVALILGPKIRQHPTLKNLKLIIHDDNRKFLVNETEPIISRPDVQQFVDGIGTHGYVDEQYQLMSEIYERYNKRFFILPDELCSGHLPFMEKALIGNWERGLHYGLDIIKGLQNRASGWVDWNMALDLEGGPGWLGGRLDSPIIVDKQRDLYYKSPMYYAIGQFSRYLPENSINLGHQIINDKFDYHFETVSFLSPDRRQLVTVILNENPYAIELIIDTLKSVGHIAPRQNAGFLVEVEPESITTVVYPLPVEYTNPAMDVV